MDNRSGPLVSCLICGNGLEEQKPMVDSESVEKFKGTFHTFCKLLNVNEEEVVEEFLDKAISVMEESPHEKDPLEELEQVAFGVACCGECFGALKDLERLEKAIEEMRATQMGHLEGLKESFISSAVKFEGRDDDWGLTRRRFLSCIASTNFCDTPDPPPIHPAKVECILSSPEDDDASLEETGHEEIIEEDEKPISLPPSPSSSPSPDLHSISSPPPNDPLVDAVNIERKRRHISEDQLGKPRQAKTPRLTPSKQQETPYISAAQQDYVQYIQPDPLSLSRQSSSQVLPENSRRSRKSAPILRNMAEEPYELIVSGSDNEDNGDSSDNFVPSSSEGESEEDESEEEVSGSRHEDSFPKRQGISTKKPPKKKERSKAPGTATVNGRRGVKRKLNSLFYQVNEDTLLYKFSLIQVSHGGTQLKCLEQNCSVLFQDLDSLSLFEKMAAHLDQDHEGSTAIKSCPFPDCQAWFPSSQGPDFRSHLLILHKVDHVLCEICWKPIREVGGTHSTHKWYHRNEQEKREVPPPVVVLKKARKCKEGKYGWLADMAVDATDTARWSVTKNENFSKLGDSLLLYKFTLIKVVPGQGFCCEDPGCSTFLANGTDFQAFEQVKSHVKSCHVAPAKGKVYAKMSRECPLCLDRNILTGGAFRNHVLSEHGSMPFICHCCWKPVKCEKLLRDHMESHLSLEEREERGLSRDPLDQLSEALSSKNPARKKFICGVCGKAFSKSYPLRTHQQTHLPPDQRRTWSCEQCPKTFAMASTLQSHVESVHVAPHLKRIRSCPICDKQFPWNDKTRFQVHMRQHTNERPFVCEICGKTFGGEVNLRLHLKGVHTEDRKFECEFCQISYKSVKNLRRHQFARHKDRVAGKDHEKSLLKAKAESRPGFIGPKIAFPCEICEKVFPLKCRLTQHVKKYHSHEKL